jgi:hypothetical protein
MQQQISNQISYSQIIEAFKGQEQFITVLKDLKEASWALSHMGAENGKISVLKREISNLSEFDVARVIFTPGTLPDRQTQVIIKPKSHDLTVSSVHHDSALKFNHTAQVLINITPNLTLNTIFNALQINYAPRVGDLHELAGINFKDRNSPLSVLYGAGGRSIGFIGNIALSLISLIKQSNFQPHSPLESARINGSLFRPDAYN